MLLETDRFAASQPILIKDDFSEIRFRLESDNPTEHVARLQLSGLPAGSYVLRDGNRTVATLEVKDAQEIVVKLPVGAAHPSRSFAISRLVITNR